VGSRLSSERGWLFALACLALGACVTVRPEDKELLADPAMTYGSGGEAQAQEDHVLANREGASGGGNTSGGGCGCN
jgi:hypothetical protein